MTPKFIDFALKNKIKFAADRCDWLISPA